MQDQISSLLAHPLGEQKMLLVSQCQNKILHTTGVTDGEGKILVLANKPRMSKGKGKAKTGFEKLMGTGQGQLWPH